MFVNFDITSLKIHVYSVLRLLNSICFGCQVSFVSSRFCQMCSCLLQVFGLPLALYCKITYFSSSCILTGLLNIVIFSFFFFSFGFQIHNFQKVLQTFPVSAANEVKVIIINTLANHKRHGFIDIFHSAKSQVPACHYRTKNTNSVLDSVIID